MLELVTSQINEYIDQLQDERVRELFLQIPSGKMLRSKLILQIAPSKEAVKLAAMVELIHMASLLHDDVIDDADLRRGQPSINATFGNKPAIMLGDILYSKAFYELSSLPSPLPQIISNAVTLLSLGELLDVELSRSFNPDIDRYMDMIYKKTASLIEASAMAAAQIAGKDSQKYGLYGKNLGLAFQIVDDILDITQDEATLGKPAMNDLKEGKTTLPYIYLYEALEERGRERLMGLFKKELSVKEKEWLQEQLQDTGSLDRAKQKAMQLGQEALECLDKEDERLRSIMTQLIDRTY